MNVEAARVAMETEFPDALLKVLEEPSTHRMVRTCMAAHVAHDARVAHAVHVCVCLCMYM